MKLYQLTEATIYDHESIRIALGEALKSNKTLNELVLKQCSIGVEGSKVLSQPVWGPTGGAGTRGRSNADAIEGWRLTARSMLRFRERRVNGKRVRYEALNTYDPGVRGLRALAKVPLPIDTVVP